MPKLSEAPRATAPLWSITHVQSSYGDAGWRWYVTAPPASADGTASSEREARDDVNRWLKVFGLTPSA